MEQIESCTAETLTCAVRQLSESLTANVWADFALTALATLVGAIAGGLLTWVFSLHVLRREQDHAYRNRLDSALAELIREIEQLYVTLPASPGLWRRKAAQRRQRDNRRVVAFDRILISLTAARLVANAEDDRVLGALTRRFLNWGQIAPDGTSLLTGDVVGLGRDASKTVREIREWRHGELTDDEAEARWKVRVQFDSRPRTSKA